MAELRSAAQQAVVDVDARVAGRWPANTGGTDEG